MSFNERLARNEQSISDIKQDISDIKTDIHDMNARVSDHMDNEERDRRVLMDRLGELEKAREKDRAFIGGIVCTVGSVVAAITFLARYAGDTIKNFFG